jgi:hypothetical protein
MLNPFRRRPARARRPGRPARRPVLESLEARTLPSLTAKIDLVGHEGGEVAAFAAADVASPAGTLMLTTLPAGAAVQSAALYGINLIDSVTPDATFAGTDLGPAAAFDADGDVTAYRWDVTGLVTGDGPYAASATGFTHNFGLQLVVTFTDPSLPEDSEVIVNDGAADLGRQAPQSTNFFPSGGGVGQLWIGTGADGPSSGGAILFNNTPAGGPVAANLGPSASLFRLDVAPVVPGGDTATVSDPGTGFGWDVAVLVRGGGVERGEDCLPTGDYAGIWNQIHQRYSNGVLLRHVCHDDFDEADPPPSKVGTSTVHTFGSSLQAEVSLDGGQTFFPVIAPHTATVTVQVTLDSESDDGIRTFSTEIQQLDVSRIYTTGGELLPGVEIRQSPTRPSRGQTFISGDGPFEVHSYFDVNTEMTLDGFA